VSLLRPIAFAASASFAIACGASPVQHPKAAVGAPVTTSATTAPSGAETPVATGVNRDAAAWASAPYPARSIARLRALLHNAPNALSMLDGMLLRFAGFDFEQPAYLTSNGRDHVFSVGVGRELAEALRKSNESEKCALVDVRGSVRLACGGEGKPSAEASRTEPPRAAWSDVHVEANGAGLRALAKSKLNDDKALDSLAGLDRMSLDLTLEGAPELRVGWHVSGEDPASVAWLNAPVLPPPPGFFALPADSEMAIFGHAPPAADQGPIKKLFLDAVGEKNSDCPATSAAERADIEKLFFTGGSFVGAVGFDRARVESAAEALTKAPADKKKLAAARDAVKAWGIFGVEEPAARWAEGLLALQKRECPKKGKPKNQITVNKKLSPRLGLPAGTVEITKVTPSSRDVLLIAPDRSTATERTWITVAHDEATAVARLKGVLAGPSALGARPGVASLREPASAGAFVTASGLALAFADETTDAQIVAEAQAVLRARDLATGGRTPIVLRMASTHDTKGKGGETSVRISLDAAALGDVAALMF
jgi:hypothetical protein